MGSDLRKAKVLSLLEKYLRNLKDCYFGEADYFHDEPDLYQYSCGRNTFYQGEEFFIGGIGTSFDEPTAKIRAIGEFIEREALIEREIGTKLSLKGKKVNIENFPEIRSDKFQKKKEKVASWISGKDLINGNKIQVPSQLVFVPYKFKKRETKIRMPISTGAAAGLTFEDAFIRGILEVIERDAFMLSYYNKKIKYAVDFKGNTFFESIKSELGRCNLELFVFDISNNLGPYVFLSLVIDRTRLGPPISAGLKAGYSLRQTILGSIEESLHSRNWLRKLMHLKPKYKSISSDKIISIMDRAMFWIEPKMIKHLDVYLKTTKKVNITDIRRTNKLNLKKQIQVLKSKGMSMYAIDLTKSGSPLKVVRVIIPELQALHLDERFKYFGDRIDKKINRLPHFFL